MAAQNYINILIRQMLVLRFGAKRPRGYPKGGMDPLGSSDHRMMEVGGRGSGGSELPKAASGIKM